MTCWGLLRCLIDHDVSGQDKRSTNEFLNMYNQRRLKKKWMRRRLKSVISKEIHHPNFHPIPKPAAAAAKTLRSCLTLCDPTDSSPPGSSVPGTLQARELEWVAISFSNACKHAKSIQSCPTLCGPMDSSPPGSSVHLIL